jgi:hypothetical protein
MGDTAAQTGRRIGYAARHWRGELPLGVSYWINLVLLATVAPVVLLRAFSLIAGDRLPLRAVATVFVLYVLAALGLWLWGAVGVWHSAGRHAGRGGRAGWALAAKTAVVLGAISTAAHLYTRYGPQLLEFGLIAAGRDPIGEFTAKLLSDGRSVQVRGALREGSAREIERVLDAAPAVKTIVLSSQGGRLAEAKTLAGLIRARGLDTYVEEVCSSACTFAFLAGRERIATRTAKIGFHAPGFAGSDAVFEASGREFTRKIYLAAGLPGAFIEHALGVPSSEMWYPSGGELMQARVVTRWSFGGESSAFASGVASKAELAQQMRQSATFKAIEARYPDIFEEALERGWAAKQRGANDSAVTAAIRSAVSEVYGRLLRDADDAMLDSFAALILRQAKAVRALGYDVCERFLDSTLNISAVLPREYGEQEEAWLRGSLEHAAAPAPPRSAEVLEAAMQRLLSRLPPEYLPALFEPLKHRGEPVRCDATIALYDAAAILEPPERHAVLDKLLRR